MLILIYNKNCNPSIVELLVLLNAKGLRIGMFNYKMQQSVLFQTKSFVRGIENTGIAQPFIAKITRKLKSSFS